MLPVALILAAQTAPAPGSVLVCGRTPDGAATAALNRWPDPVPKGVLFLYWPSRLDRLAVPPAFPEAVLDGGGAVFPLSVVLARLGIPAPRTFNDLLEALGVGFGDVLDVEFLGKLLVKVLAEKLAAVLDGEGIVPPAPAKYPPRPEVAVAVETLPPSPGVYLFMTGENRPLYVGKARSLSARVQQYFGPHPAEADKSARLARDAVSLRWETTGSELEALLREHRCIRRDRPLLNVQETVRARDRGAWRTASALLALPSVADGCLEVCLVAGEGRFHWERVARGRHVPAALWRRVKAFLDGAGGGWAPGEPGAALLPGEERALSEITLSWMVDHADRVSRIDLAGETGGRALAARIRRLLGEDPSAGRVEIL
jgi:hypothetical protein